MYGWIIRMIIRSLNFELDNTELIKIVGNLNILIITQLKNNTVNLG